MWWMWSDVAFSPWKRKPDAINYDDGGGSAGERDRKKAHPLAHPLKGLLNRFPWDRRILKATDCSAGHRAGFGSMI